MALDKLVTTIRLPEPTYEKVRYLAYVERRSINGMVEHAIKAYVDAYEKKYGPIQLVEPPDPLKPDV